MSTCYKCGRELPDGQVECEDYCLTPGEQEEMSDAEFARDFMEVDWSKVETLKQVIAILAASGEYTYVRKGSPEFERVKELLKPINNNPGGSQ